MGTQQSTFSIQPKRVDRKGRKGREGIADSHDYLRGLCGVRREDEWWSGDGRRSTELVGTGAAIERQREEDGEQR
jgi:hypothetical protein